MSSILATSIAVNPVGASWFEDLTSEFLDECIGNGTGLVGCTANDTWDDTLETMENLQTVKRIVEGHPNAFIVRNRSDLGECGNGRVGVFLGLQNPKSFSDSLNFLEAFIDMGLRCCSLAFRDNSYYGCGFSSPNDSGLSHIGAMAVRTLNRRGVVIDLSHSGDRTAADAIETSEDPVIFSHSMSRELMTQGPKVEWAGIKNNAVLRAAPNDLIIAAASKGGVVCPDARIAGSVEVLLKHIEHMVKLVGIDHVAVCAQDDWHRSSKDVRRIQPYLPGYDSVTGKGARVTGSDYRIYRMEDQLGPKILAADKLGVQLREIFSETDAQKILGGNLERVFATVLQ
ncbi:microsomal dipeptidase-like Zn-dependent dipeptidase [Variovorax boronicumulans]|uniref:dipeptidase n=1 Tax=Variovorax boronicumulans TaxID=436515 RepID=UPI002475B0FB|nr:membrane dipeptidase [Variovorax boronicumulans]MDH6169987.1 microsomal dipeptidase-like Zn-dependent dipeptidase [Variovorax boronicumulans]